MVKGSSILMAVLASAVLFACQAAGAASEGSGGYRLKDLERFAVERHLAVQAAVENFKAMENQVGEMRGRFGPDVTARGSAIPDGAILENDPDAFGHGGYVRLEQDLVRLLRIRPGRIEEAKLDRAIAEAELAEARNRAILETRLAYLESLEEKLQAECCRRMAALLEELLDLTTRRYRSQEALRVDVLKTEKDLVDARVRCQALEKSFLRKRDHLAKLLSIEAERIAFDDLPSDLRLPEAAVLVNSARVRRVLTRQFEAKAKQENVRASTAGLEEVRLYPYAGLRVTDDDGARPEVGIVFSMPLGVAKIREHRTEKLQHLARYWSLEARRAGEEAAKEILSAYQQVEVEESRIQAALKGKELAVEQIRIEQSRLAAPTSIVQADRVNLLAMELELAQYGMEQKVAEAARAKAFYRLLFLAGVAEPEDLEERRDRDAGSSLVPSRMWVWGVEKLLGDEGLQRALLDLCRARGIDEVYLSLNRSLMARLPADEPLRNLLAALQASGIRISALFGENLWIYEENRGTLLDHLRVLTLYNAQAEPAARFHAVHLDIEPHALEEWKGNEARLLALFLATCRDARRVLARQEPVLPLAVDIPAHYDRLEGAILDEIAREVDGITVMAYGIKSADGLVRAVQGEMSAAAKAGKPVVVGVNAREFAGRGELLELLEALEERLRDAPAFHGFAVHDFDHYRAMEDP